MASRSTAEPRGSVCSRLRSSSLSARARMSSRNASGRVEAGADSAPADGASGSSAANRVSARAAASGPGAAAARASNSCRMAICDTAPLRSSRGFRAAASPVCAGPLQLALIASSRLTASISACRSLSRAASERSRIRATDSNARAACASARESLASKRSTAELKESGIPDARGSRAVPFRRAIRSRRPAAASSRPSWASSSCGRARCSRAAWSVIASSSQSSRRIPARRAASSAASRVRRPTPAIVHAIALFMSSTIAGGRESSRV